VDYAHTDDALRNLLETVRQVTRGRVIAVFGCGGDRDRTKRPLMGGHAARLADEVWVTSDNPRSEPPEAIIGEILAGIAGTDRDSGRIHAEPDRRRAIEQAIGAARSGDTVVIAGKGHETYQIIGDRITAFDDRAVARSILERLRHDEGADGSP
jgi:UDP-N-acetylmuramoyl-L-alanyl-D-glutamate--2,6-diaminopimelate ligase